MKDNKHSDKFIADSVSDSLKELCDDAINTQKTKMANVIKDLNSCKPKIHKPCYIEKWIINHHKTLEILVYVSIIPTCLNLLLIAINYKPFMSFNIFFIYNLLCLLFFAITEACNEKND